MLELGNQIVALTETLHRLACGLLRRKGRGIPLEALPEAAGAVSSVNKVREAVLAIL